MYMGERCQPQLRRVVRVLHEPVGMVHEVGEGLHGGERGGEVLWEHRTVIEMIEQVEPLVGGIDGRYDRRLG
jgi:hypothetical protein